MSNSINDPSNTISVSGVGTKVESAELINRILFTNNQPQVVYSDSPSILQTSSSNLEVTIVEQPTKVTIGMAGTSQNVPQQAQNLGDLEDVILLNLQQDQQLKYNQVLGVWQNSSVTDGGNF